MKSSPKKYQSCFRDSDDPEIRELALEIERKREAGIIKDPPRRQKDIKNIEDLARYVFKRVDLAESYQMLFQDGSLKRLVWPGPEFSDAIVKLVCEIAPLVPDRDTLRELRLVGTSISKSGMKKLQKALPLVKISVITEEEEKENWRWTQAVFPEEPVCPD
jgi:hypothetical protein